MPTMNNIRKTSQAFFWFSFLFFKKVKRVIRTSCCLCCPLLFQVDTDKIMIWISCNVSNWYEHKTARSPWNSSMQQISLKSMEYSQAAQTHTSPLSVYFVCFMQKIVTHPQLFKMCVVKKNVVFISSSLALEYVRESESSEAVQESKSTFPSLFPLL